MTADGVLVLAFGNPLRGDDGVGWHVAAALRADDRLADAEIRACHQLTPELAQDVAGAELVVLIDARDDGSPPGSVSLTQIHTGCGPFGRSRAHAQSHSFDPTDLVSLASELFESVPPVVVVTVGVGDADVGDRLSPQVALAVPVATSAVMKLIGGDGTVALGEPGCDMVFPVVSAVDQTA